MKKLIPLFICVILIFSGCSGTDDNTVNNDARVGEGTLTALRSLVNTNAYLVENVFVKNHLPVDEEKSVEHNGKKLYPVVSEQISSFDELKNILNSTYTKEVAEKTLNESGYVELDGVLYFDASFITDVNYEKDWSDFEIDAASIFENEYSIEIIVKNQKGKKIALTAQAVNSDGSLRLEEMCS